MTNPVRWVYLLLAILGAILPWQANLEFMQAQGGAASTFSNSSRMPMSTQLRVHSVGISDWSNSRQHLDRGGGTTLQVKRWWIALVACFSISFACGAPLFLFLREARLKELEMENGDQS